MNFIDKMVERFIKLNRRMKRWQRVVSVMAAVVVFATTYALILPAITLDTDTATTQAGIEVVASENEPDEAGTVFESEEEEEPAAEDNVQEEESGEAVAEENSGSESGGQDAVVSDALENQIADEGEQTVVLTTEEVAAYATTEEAIAAVTGQTAEEVKLISEDAQLTYEGSDYIVYADFDESAKFPEGVQLRVKEITKESDPEAYEVYYQKALSEMQDKYDENTTLSFAKFYDIAFVYEDVEIEPSGNVNVRIEYKKAVEIEKTTTVDTIHFDKNEGEKAEVINSDTKGSEKEVEAIEFESDQFSVYGVVGTEKLTAQVITAEGETYTIEVTCGPDTKIPAGAELRVREIEQGSDEFFEYYNRTIRELGFAPLHVIDEDTFEAEFESVYELLPEVPQARYFDISIVSDGIVIEPEAPVEVKIIYNNELHINDNNEIKSVHFVDSDEVDINSASTQVKGDKTEISFTQGGFSTTGTIEAPTDGDKSLPEEGGVTAEFTVLRDRGASGENNGPATTKTVRDNGNGTHTIRLDILGEVEQQTEITRANVIVILDTSGSMSNSVSGGGTRWTRAVAAVNNVASTLLGKNNKDGIAGNDDDDIVEMALVTFGTSASTPVTKTTSASTISTALNRITPSGATNWEDALQEAAGVNFNNDGNPTYVIFISDGNPTFRQSWGGYNTYLPRSDNLAWSNNNTYYAYRGDDAYYDDYGVYGLGNDSQYNAYGQYYANYSPTSMQRCYDQAKDDAAAVVSSGRQFYGIGVYGNAAWVNNLVNDSGAPSNHYYNAADAAALSAALSEIADAITSNLGFSNVSTSDGVTALSSISAKVVDGHATGFKYYKNGDVWADAPEATPTADGITWDLSSENPLADKTTYSIEFDIWPSQEAYDTVANLNNGLITYASLDQTVKDQINDNGDGTYSLKTNTSLTTTYTKNGVTDTDEWDKGNTAMALDVRTFKVRKLWNNSLDSRDTSKVQLIVTKDGQNYLDGDHIIELTADSAGNMISDDIFISCGFITHESTGYDVKEHGHDYSIKEPENYSYYWDLTAAVYRPMVIDGTPHMLVKTDSPTGTDGTDYYVIDGSTYQVRDTETILEATNDRRSYLNLSKAVTDDSVDQSADPDALFEYTLTVGKVGEPDIWFSAQDNSGTTQTISEHSSNVSEEVRDGATTGYYYVPAGSEFSFSIKNGWNVRFTNLPTGTTYTIQETNMPEGFEFVNAVSSATGDEAATPATISGQSASGTINKANTDYSVAYTNKWATKEITIVKVDENKEEISDAAFTLTTGNPETEVATFVSDSTDKDTDGAVILGNKFKLPYGVYCLTETEAPDGYVILANKIYFKIDATNGLMLCDKDGNPASYEKVSVSINDLTLTVENTPGKALPKTGGPGTSLYTLGGLMLILASALMYGFRMRRGERRFK